MKRIVSTFALAGGLVLAGVPSLAADVSVSAQPTMQSQKERLEDLYDEIASRSTARKVPAMEQAMRAQQEREIRDLIRRVEAGERVSSSEIDHAVRMHRVNADVLVVRTDGSGHIVESTDRY